MSVDPAVLEALVARIGLAEPRLGPAGSRIRLVVVDGPAGSGKSTLAAQLADALRSRVVHMDDLYGGWHGLEEAWSLLDKWVLSPLAEGRPGRYRRFDWEQGRFEEWHPVPLAPFLVVEGCGSARLEADAVASLRIWVEAPDDLRLVRGLDRDGEGMRPQWLEFMAGEREHYTRNRTRERADVLLDGWGREVHEGGPRSLPG